MDRDFSSSKKTEEVIDPMTLLKRDGLLLLKDVLDPLTRRVSYSVTNIIPLLRFARKNGLVISKAMHPAQIAKISILEVDISLPRTVNSLDIETWFSEFSDFYDAQSAAKILYERIANLIVAEACSLIDEIYCMGEDMKTETPSEIAIMHGLFYGYKACCVRYFLNTRNYGAIRHSNEIIYTKSGLYIGVPCESCANNRK